MALFATMGDMASGTIRSSKTCPVRLDWQEIRGAVAVFTDNAIRPTHAVNPLDVQGEIISYEPLPIPPHLIFRVAEIQKDWFVFSGEHRVHLPRRFTPTGAVPAATESAEPKRSPRGRRERDG